MEIATPSVRPDSFVRLHEGQGMPVATFLMPVYNQARYVGDAVRSVLAQEGVTIEIILSDDCSKDETFARALDTIQDHLRTKGSRHSIIVRNGAERLWRDHLPLLLDHASCDVVCQAHGDDVSHPKRALLISKVFMANPKVSMMSGDAQACRTDKALCVNWEQLPQRPKIMVYQDKNIVQGAKHLIGFNQAWRRSLVSSFPRLDRSYAAVGHDRILPLRAFMNGLVVHVNATLVRRRLHDQNAHSMMFDEPSTRGDFGWSLSALTRLAPMENDIQFAFETHLISEGQYSRLLMLSMDFRTALLQRLIISHRDYTRAGLQVAWVDEEALLRLKNERTLKRYE